MTGKTRLQLAPLVVALGCGIFVLDLLLPLGIAVGVLYTALVLLSLWSTQRWLPLKVAQGASVLIVLGFFLFQRLTGSLVWIGISNRALSLLILWVTTILVLRYKRSEEDLRDRETRLQLLHEQLPALIWTTDTHLRITSTQGASLVALNLEPQQMVGTTVVEHFPDDPEAAPLAAHRHALRGEPHSYEMTIRERVFEAHVEPLRTADGTIAGCLGIALDITERMQAERARQILIHKLQAALDNIKNLRGLLPICAACNKIRDHQGRWEFLETYIQEHSEAQFTHSICPQCTEKLYPHVERT